MSSHHQILGNTASPPILSCQNVSKSIENNRQHFDILENVNLDVEKDGFVTILGQSGSGKSTLLKLLGGFIPPSSGQVLFHGVPLNGITPKVGMVFQENTLYPWLTVEQNIGFGFQVRGKAKNSYSVRVKEIMEHVGLYHARHLYPHQLSGGMKQRVSIARSIAVQPDVLLLDEPFSALDVQLRRKLQKFLLSIWEETYTSMVLVTHDVEEAILLGQELIVIGDKPGKIVESVDISASAYQDRYSRQFLDLQRHLESLIEGTSSVAESELEVVPFST